MSCQIINPFNIFNDAKMPFLKEAISPDKVEYYFQHNIPLITDNYQVVQIKVIRYKPQRRCLIKYTFQDKNLIILIGKVRAKGTDIKSYSLQKELWHNGFNDNSFDKISVPEPIGIISQWQMWIQKKVSGDILTSLLGSDRGIDLSQKVAYVAHKLHQTKINPSRRHTIIEELQILHQKLPLVLEYYPHWQTRIKLLLKKCDHEVARERDRLGKNMVKNKL